MPGVQKFTYWEILYCNILSNPPEVHTTHLLDLMVDYQLAHLIKEPTRVNANSQTLIGVFITNKEDNISHSGVYTLSISDHNLIYAVRKIVYPGDNQSLFNRGILNISMRKIS